MSGFFHWYNPFMIHPWCGRYQYFISFYNNNILLHGYIAFCLFILQLMNIYVVSIFLGKMNKAAINILILYMFCVNICFHSLGCVFVCFCTLIIQHSSRLMVDINWLQAKSNHNLRKGCPPSRKTLHAWLQLSRVWSPLSAFIFPDS